MEAFSRPHFIFGTVRQIFKRKLQDRISKVTLGLLNQKNDRIKTVLVNPIFSHP